MAERKWDMRRQGSVYTSIVVAAFVLASLPGTSPYFKWFFGDLSPGFVVLIAGVVGAVCLGLLRRFYGFEILRRGSTIRGVAVGTGFASVLAVTIVVADLALRYPKDINAPLPHALAFYPSVGLVAEIVFHILPLTLVLVLLLPLPRHLGTNLTTWIAIVLVAVAEPTFQVFFGGETLALIVYSWVHVFAIALLQLYVFRQYDFISMYSFRLVYYAYWHVLWGFLRLELLF